MNWPQTQLDTIKRALRIIGVLGQGDQPSSDQTDEGKTALNALFKELAHEGIYLYKIDWISRALAATSVVLHNAVSYTCIRAHTSSASTEPGVGADWNTYWKVSGTSVIAWATATSYTCLNNIVLDSDILHILKIFIRDTSGIDHPVNLISREEYADVTDKSSGSTYPYSAWWNRQDNTIYLEFFPSSTTSYVVHIQAQTPIDTLTNNADLLDSPVNYYDLLAFGLAYKLSFEYVIPIQERDYIKLEFNELKSRLKENDIEDVDYNYKRGAF